MAEHDIKPIIVGGLSVEIYTQQEYSTRDIDSVSDGYHIIEDILFSIGFKKEGKNFYHEDIEIAIEIPDNHLAGNTKKVVKVQIDSDNYIYIIGIEDIILDRLRAGIYWKSEEDQIWAFKLLSSNYQSIDIDYLKQHTETQEEIDLLLEWVVYNFRYLLPHPVKASTFFATGMRKLYRIEVPNHEGNSRD